MKRVRRWLGGWRTEDDQKRVMPETMVRHRDVAKEISPEDGGVAVFDTPDAHRINKARLDQLASLDLPLSGSRVLDVGCGVGHHAAFYIERDCDVVCIDGRDENIEVLRGLHPGLEAHVRNVEHEDLTDLGDFDIVHCYGLLYHLENPVAALRNIARVCHGLLLIETIVCDHPLPILRFEDETLSSNQALHGIACRPSAGFIALALNRIGFAHVYRAKEPPDHEDFRFDPVGNLDFHRDGHNLRMVFVASRQASPTERLMPMLVRP